ncbi:hypothetical protein C5H79_09185 [Oenococcus oeni]|nr:hypothetical protein C5H79_09185 [Oenococcus oeni]RJF39231.1 hypothetical protein D5F74_01675 [Oenococcus oeni]
MHKKVFFQIFFLTIRLLMGLQRLIYIQEQFLKRIQTADLSTNTFILGKFLNFDTSNFIFICFV